MPDVRNWQLGRTMAYPYAEHHPEHQFAFVFNINRCLACQTCSMACKSTWTFSEGQEYMWWNNVETKPYGGYPRHWDVKVLDLLDQAHRQAGVEPAWQAGTDDREAPYGSYEGMTIFEAAAAEKPPARRAIGYLPTEEEWRAPNIFEDVAVQGRPAAGSLGLESGGAQLPEHIAWFFYLQRLCNHCTYPACLAACPRKAIYKRPEDGIVLIDQARCRGYRKCVEACPYKKSMYRPTTRVSEKCVACYPRIEGKDPLSDGVPMETRCMSSCPGKIRLQGLAPVAADGSWADDPQNPITFLVRDEQVALPLYPQLGTEPNGFYIPPRWAPRDFLRQMFGPGVDRALERYRAPSRELLAVLQLFRASQQIIFRFEIEEGPRVFETEIDGKPWAMYNDTVIGFDQQGREAVRLTVEEPIHQRPAPRPNSI
ncbi:MAG: nitrate oxidoreductase subunit beta [Chloroflexi bacterium GWC2_73_18]|nr:MAG: nitrate oxidoreductase subunit beta [Chloroflexi bacterium GWC2_73_18]